MHGLIFRKSIHYWQDQPGSRRPLKAAGQKGVTRKNTGTQVLGEKITTVHEPAAILAGPQVSPNPFFRRPGPTRSAPPRPAAFFGMAAKISRNRPPKEALSRRDRQPSLARLAIFSRLAGLYHQKPLAAPRSPPPRREAVLEVWNSRTRLPANPLCRWSRACPTPNRYYVPLAVLRSPEQPVRAAH